jgi:Zn-dependent membrane protease YugP
MLFFESPIGLLLALMSLVITIAAQLGMKNAYSKYSKIHVYNNLTGAEVARLIVQDTGVSVIQNNGGQLSDHFDPRKNIIALSPDVYKGNTVAALGIAAHEAGHALQYDQGYFPIKLRNGILPVAKIGSSMAMPMVLIGIIFSTMSFLIDIGIMFFIAVLIFQIITLPVEYNASRRAIAILDNNAYLTPIELSGAKVVLRAASMTYVAAVVTSLLQLLRLLLMANRRR